MIKRITSNTNFKNIAWNLADAILYPIALLIATPYYIQGLGDEVYGLWMLLTSVVVSVGVLNGGLADTTIQYIAKYRALQDASSVRRVFRTTFSLTFFIAALLLVLGPFIAYSVVALDLFDIPKAEDKDIFLLLIISLVTLAVKLLEQIFFAYYKAHERFDIYSKSSIAIRLLTISLNFLLIVNEYRLLHVLLSSLAVSVVFLVPLMVYTGKIIGFRQLLPKYDTATIHELRRFTTWSWFQTTIGIANSQADKFLVAGMAGLQTLTYYSIGLMVVNQIHMVLSTGASTLFPMISKKSALAENTADFFYNFQQLVTVAGLLIILQLSLVKEFVFTLWLGPEVYLRANEFLTLFFAYQLVASCTVAPFYYLIGSGRIRMNAYNQLLVSVLTLLAMVVFYYSLGNVGLVTGKVVALLVALLILFVYLKKQIFREERPAVHFKSLAICVAAVGVLAVNSIYLTIAFVLYLYFSVFMLAKVKGFFLPNPGRA